MRSLTPFNSRQISSSQQTFALVVGYKPLNAARLLACFAVLVLAAVGIICQHKKPSGHPPISASAPLIGVAAVQGDPFFKAASRDYDQHHFAKALTQLCQLSRAQRYQHNGGAQQYLDRQEDICRLALGIKVAPAPGPSPRIVAARPVLRQADCGPRALLLVCRNYGIQTDLQTLKRQAGTTGTGTTLSGLADAAKRNGLKASGVQMDAQALSQLSHPALAWVEGDHYIAVLGIRDGIATIHDPNVSHSEDLTTQQLWSRCGGILLTLQRS